MIKSSTVETLKALKLSAMAKELERQLADEAYITMKFEDRIGLLVDTEWNQRQSTKLKRYLRNARFAIPGASIEGIEYYEERNLDKATILRFASCNYIDEGRHIILKGMSGNGKTYIACALGNAACRKFKTVRYIRMPELIEEFAIAKAEGTFKKTMDAYRKVELLIIDEWLIRNLTVEESYDILELAEARCCMSYNGVSSRNSRGSTIFCTQYDNAGWYTRISADPGGESTISDAVMDRIIHNAYIMVIGGSNSMRERYGLKAEEK